MDNRELEVFLLKEMEKISDKFQIKPSVDFKYDRNLTLPRIVSRTLSNKTINKFEDREEGKKGIFKQYEVHQHVISFSFTLSENESFEDVEKIKKKFEHKIGFDWFIARSGKSIVIEEVTATVDLSELTKDSYTERYSFDMYINTLEENIAEIEYIEKVEIEVKAR